MRLHRGEDGVVVAPNTRRIARHEGLRCVQAIRVHGRHRAMAVLRTRRELMCWRMGRDVEGRGRGMFVAAVLGRYRYHQSRRCLPGTSSTMSMGLIQRVASLTVDGALCPGLARVRDARERKTCCLSVALTEGAAAAFTQPSQPVSPSGLCTHLPITITSHAK